MTSQAYFTTETQHSLKKLRENIQLGEKQTSLTTLLLLYSKAQEECYLDYNMGFKALLNYLTDTGVPISLERFVSHLVVCSL